MNYTKKNVNEYNIFEINGDFVISKISDLLDEYTKLIKNEQYKFIFDLYNVKFIDSSAIGTIIMGTSNVLEHNSKIKIIIDPNNEFIRETFRIIKLDQVFDYYTSQEDALKNYNKLEI